MTKKSWDSRQNRESWQVCAVNMYFETVGKTTVTHLVEVKLEDKAKLLLSVKSSKR